MPAGQGRLPAAVLIKPAHRVLASSAQVKDASLLRFLVDMRDADLEAKQMRDDLMTMLIAGEQLACESL